MKISRIKDVKMPTRGTSASAGIDFYTPNSMLTTELLAGESALIPSGIKARLPQGYALIAFNKSGVATKQGLQVGKTNKLKKAVVTLAAGEVIDIFATN